MLWDRKVLDSTVHGGLVQLPAHSPTMVSFDIKDEQNLVRLHLTKSRVQVPQIQGVRVPELLCAGPAHTGCRGCTWTPVAPLAEVQVSAWGSGRTMDTFWNR